MRARRPLLFVGGGWLLGAAMAGLSYWLRAHRNLAVAPSALQESLDALSFIPYAFAVPFMTNIHQPGGVGATVAFFVGFLIQWAVLGLFAYALLRPWLGRTRRAKNAS